MPLQGRRCRRRASAGCCSQDAGRLELGAVVSWEGPGAGPGGAGSRGEGRQGGVDECVLYHPSPASLGGRASTGRNSGPAPAGCSLDDHVVEAQRLVHAPEERTTLGRSQSALLRDATHALQTTQRHLHGCGQGCRIRFGCPRGGGRAQWRRQADGAPAGGAGAVGGAVPRHAATASDRVEWPAEAWRVQVRHWRSLRAAAGTHVRRHGMGPAPGPGQGRRRLRRRVDEGVLHLPQHGRRLRRGDVHGHAGQR
mmetsp:Transcript_36008/g.91660  ORF Transcript_36008/g.91660 Transcript_36008/m.91660 type:complete len:253 (+) Transcript_36008:667-1425(+)